MLSEDTATTSSVSFHSRVASVMAVVAQSAVAEISKLYDDGLLVLRLEVCRKDSEIEALKIKLETVENELRLLKESQGSGTPRLLPAPCALRRGKPEHLYSSQPPPRSVNVTVHNIENIRFLLRFHQNIYHCMTENTPVCLGKKMQSTLIQNILKTIKQAINI